MVKVIVRERPVVGIALVDTETVEKARSIHDTYPTASAAFGRVVTGALLLSSFLEEGQKVMVQVICEGPVKEIVAEADWAGRVRGYIKRPHIHLELKDGKLDVGRAVGKGTLYVVKDLGLKEPYIGSVPLQTGEIGYDLAYYLAASEQINAAVSLGVYVEKDNSVRASGGFLIHVLPEMDEGTVEYLERRVKALRPVTSMILEGLGPEEILKEVLDLPFDVAEEKKVSYHCPCSRERVLDAIASLGEKDIRELLEKGKTISVSCHFCNRRYRIRRDELISIVGGKG